VTDEVLLERLSALGRAVDPVPPNVLDEAEIVFSPFIDRPEP
jgi:hypothetical protein